MQAKRNSNKPEQVESEQPKSNKVEQEGEQWVDPCSLIPTKEFKRLHDKINDIDQPEQTVENIKLVIAVSGLEHYRKNPDKYIQRREPEKLNWGKPMTRAELHDAGLKANRVTIPGDWDYKVAC